MCFFSKTYRTCALEHCQARFVHQINYFHCDEAIQRRRKAGHCRQTLVETTPVEDSEANVMCSNCLDEEARLQEENKRRQRLYNQYVRKHGSPHRRSSF